jgi:aminoglycoside 6-adenylyltransferase
MQFADGNRIDLTLFPIAKLDRLEHDSLSLLLLDKDGLFEPFAPPSDSDYLPRPPSAQAFSDCCNEFWWVCPNVAKGLWREEISYAKYMLDQFVRDQLMNMLRWYVGVKTQFSHSPGKFGKYLRQYLEPELWDMLLKTYSDADYEHTWQALSTMCDLFRITATRVAAHYGLEYPYSDDERVSAHLQHVRSLPKDAKELY